MLSTQHNRNLHKIPVYVWLFLAIIMASNANPVAAAPSATIETCFAPENDCAAFAVQAIDRAEREILVGAYGLTTGFRNRRGAAARSSARRRSEADRGQNDALRPQQRGRPSGE